MGAWAEVVARVRGGCGARGLDLVQALRVGWYNEAVEAEYRLPDFGRPGALALCIGNTRALWARFLEARREEPNPLDAYVERSVREVLATTGVTFEVRFAHEAPPRRVAMQRLAHVSGLAYLAPSQLVVHPTYGPWIGLRAAVVFDTDGPPGPPPALVPPCSCDATCLPKLREATAAREGDWQAWLAVRDACPVGREHRYDDDQIRYHYTKDPDALVRGG